MGCKFEYRGKWYEEADLKALFESSQLVRLYRSENDSIETNIPEWLVTHPEFKDIQDATGRWFYRTEQEAREHALRFGSSGISYIDIPISEVEKYNARDNKFSGGYGRDGNEYFIPKELANNRQTLLQASGTEGSKASTETVNKVTEWLKRVGVSVKDVPYINAKGERVDANGRAKLLENVVEIVEGKHNVALVEEAMHFATYIIQQANPTLYKKMLNQISQFPAYKEIFDRYKTVYTKDGKPDVPKIKFEAIGKILAEHYVQNEEGVTDKPELLEKRTNWIQQIIDWFKSMFLKHPNPFQQALSEIETAGPIKQRAFSLESSNPDITIKTTIDTRHSDLEGGTIHDTKVLDKLDDVGYIQSENDGTYLTVINTNISGSSPNTGTMAYLRLAQEAKSQGLTLRSDRIRDRMSPQAKALWNRFVRGGQAEISDGRYIFTGDPNEVTEGTLLQATEDELISKLDHTSSTVVNKPLPNGDNDYFIGAVKVFQRVTRYVKEITGKKFKNRGANVLVDDQKRQWGSRGHRDMERLIGRYLTSEGKIVVQDGKIVPQNNDPLKSELDPTGMGMFNAMHQYVVDLLLSYPADTVFRTEQTIYSSKGGKPGERDIAGTMDFVAIKSDGKRDILDWKFVEIRNKENADTDIQFYKQEEWKLQMGEYKKILKRDYNFNDENFGKTRMVPIVVSYARTGDKIRPTLTPEDVEIGSVDLSIDDKAYLLPVVTSDESTGNAELDNLVQKLTGLYNTLLTIPAPDKQRNIKNEQLNNLFRAIRHLQVAKNFGPLTEQVGILIKDAERVIKEHKDKFTSLDNLTEQDISDEAANLLLKAQALHIYQNLDVQFSDVYGDNPTEEQKAILEKLNEVTAKARHEYTAINKIIQEFGDKYIAGRRGITGLLEKEKSVTGITRNFNTTSELPPAAMQTLYLMVDNANNKIQFDLAEVRDELVELKKEVDKWGGLKKALPLIRKTPAPKEKDETEEAYKRRVARESNKLIDEFDSEFYDQLQESIATKDIDWIKANIDMDAFTKHLKERQKEVKKVIEDTRYSYDDIQNQTKKAEALKKLALTTDPSKPEAYLEEDQYYILKKFPKDTWQSAEFKALKAQEPVYKFYQFIRKWNQKSRDIGYIQDRNVERNFLPYLYKTFSEKINLEGVSGIFTGMGDAFMNSISIDENVAGYGSYNELTGQIEDKIPTYFTRTIDNPEQISEDLFVNMAAYIRAVINYDYKSQIDGQVKALYFIEQNKGSLQVDSTGKLIKLNGVPQPQSTNDKNADLLNNHIKSIQYGQKYTNVEATDALLGDWAKGYNKFAEAANKKMGFGILPKLSEGKQVSATRLMDRLNRFFTVKNMGLNVATSLSVLLGGNFQALINSGKYYTSADLLSSEFQHASHYVFGNREKHMALIKAFMPVDEELNRELAKLAAGKLTDRAFADFMMTLMRKADHIVQYANFLAFMKNTIVLDGKLYNARDYYRNSKEYANRYNLSAADRAKMESQFDEKVNELLNKNGITEKVKVDSKGNLKIDGIDDIKNDNVFRYRTLINAIGKRATGNVSPENEMLIRMNAIFRSMLVFKNWIPGLIKQRIGGLRHDQATGTYEYGRLRMLIKHLGPLALFKINDITNILKGNEKGVALMKEYFKNQKESYHGNTNKELKMSEAEFMDMFRQNLSGQIKELAILVSMMAIVMAILPLFKPDDDEEMEVKNRFKFASRLLDKVKDEVWFYYNPVGLQQILNGSIFPALGLFTDAYNVVKSTMTEIYGVTVGGEEITDKNFVLKNWMKALPLTREMTYYIAMFDADLAKELGIQISSQSRMK